MIEINDLILKAGSFELRIDSFQIPKGEYFVLLGPTGSGKTLLLETIAGLTELQNGSISFDSIDVTTWPPERRQVGFVYQDYLLFPHLTVKQNVSFGLRHVSSERRERSVKEIAALLRIEDLLHRLPHNLSGGERQRVALARALVPQPKILLLDEPLSALDSETRESLQEELRRLHRFLRPTVLHVTHNNTEAMALADRVGVLSDGRLRQVGHPQEIHRQPSCPFVARFMGGRNLFPARADGRCVTLENGLKLLTDQDAQGLRTAVIRPEEIHFSRVQSHKEKENDNCIQGTVENVSIMGAWTEVRVTVPPTFTVFLTRPDWEITNLRPGDQVHMTFPPSAVHLCSE